ncbi:MAG: hypothetical protein BWY59_00587 [Verrucomicrobia bacterium ADurb.Bin345]|nr:MAG: hypothetical protein BWY59_00587 [Verrucomicrobia bacterium ADurb.Bin345]
MSEADKTHNAPRRLHLGCGEYVMPGWVNHDMAALPGVDVVCDLAARPWPFADNEFDEVRMINVLEHLPDVLETMEELGRITKPGARLCLRVPYWNARDTATDPTHKSSFSEYSFDYFDVTTDLGRRRSYYSKARFHIDVKRYYLNFVFGSYSRFVCVTRPWLRALLSGLARYFCGVIWAFEVELTNVKPS